MTQATQGQTQTIDPDRLQELLRPVRDIAEVWNIQLADILDDYFENIAGIDLTQSFDPDALNFSEAGLLILGSTNIYAKKVKHLYELVTSSTAIPELEGDTTKKGKKKQKQIDWVVDDNLAPIDDIEVMDTTMLEQEDPRLEITTMPKIPFCLLQSFDHGKDEESKYRCFNVPNEENGVIILDGTQRNVDFNDDPPPESDRGFNLHIQDAPMQPEPPEPYGDEDADIPMPDGDEVPMPEPYGDDAAPNADDYQPPEEHESDEYQEPVVKKPAKRQKKQKPAQLLDPNASSKPLKRKFELLTSFAIPTSFNPPKAKKTMTKKPFHEDFFEELFLKLKNEREKRLRTEDLKAANEVAVEEGREHLIDNIDLYVEAPVQMPSDAEPIPFDNDIPMPDMTNYGDDDREYQERVYDALVKMQEESKDAKHQSEIARSLENWEKKLTPVLEAELKRKIFDITETRRWIALITNKNGGTITFRKLTSGLMPHEISRVFLSCLMLANTSDIVIDQHDKNDQYGFTIHLQRQYEEIIKRFDEYKTDKDL